MIRVGFHIHVATTLNYPVMGPFPLFVALSDHNPPTLQTDKRMARQALRLQRKLNMLSYTAGCHTKKYIECNKNITTSLQADVRGS